MRRPDNQADPQPDVIAHDGGGDIDSPDGVGPSGDGAITGGSTGDPQPAE